jgi:hypothetical protein
MNEAETRPYVLTLSTGSLGHTQKLFNFGLYNVLDKMQSLKEQRAFTYVSQTFKNRIR